MRLRSSHSWYLILLIALASLNVSAQLKHERNTGKIAAMYRETKADTNRVNVLLRWSTVLFDRQWRKSTDFDSAFLLADQAYKLSDKIKFDKGIEESIFLKGNYYIQTQHRQSLDSLMKVVSSTLNVRLLIRSIEFYSASDEKSVASSDSIIHILQKARDRMVQEKQIDLAVRSMIEIGTTYYRKGEMEEGAKMYVDAFHYARKNNSKKGEETVLKATNYFLFTEAGKELLGESFKYEKELTLLYPTLTKKDDLVDAQISLSTIAGMLSMYYMHKGRITESLDVCLRAIKLFESNNGTLEVAQLPDEVGRTFYRTENYDLTLKYCLMAFAIYKRDNQKINADLFKFIARGYVSLGRSAEGLEFMQKNVRIEDYSPYEQTPILAAFGDCYFGMGNYSKAEKYYLESSRIAKSLSAMAEAISYYPLGKLYVEIRQYQKAKSYLNEVTHLVDIQMIPVWVQRDMQHLLFKADSATGNYLSAINHLNQFRVLNDSIFNINRNRQIEELKIQFENDKKDAELKSKEQNIQLLTKQGELQRAELEQTTILRNSFVAGVIVLFALLALTYNRFRLKQRTNKLLEDKQEKINSANDSLQHANQQLQRLLDEKEWLVKEIHHRVKNNLQIVVSLLNTQANHLSESEALTAIRESQQRMQVISLLHQRLYRMEESRLVDMTTYIRELTGYISESYRTAKSVYLVIEAQNVFLDISQAVSIGLVLNESITNSYKYAFNERLNGLIKISLEATDPNCLMLRVSDNGIGLPSEFSSKKKASMGMRLIETLADQLDGHLSIENENGVVISIQFKPIQNELNPTSNEIEITT